MPPVFPSPHDTECLERTPLSLLPMNRRTFLNGAIGLGVGVAALGAGLLGDPTYAAAQTDLLLNGGFDDVVDGMPRDWRLFGAASAPHLASSQARVRSTGSSVRLADPDATAVVGLRSAPAAVTAGGTYDAGVHVFIERGEASFYLEFWNASGVRVWNQFRTSSITGSWQYLDLRGTAPDDAVEATVLIYSSRSNAGTAYFDDAALTAVTPLVPQLAGPASLTAAVRGAVVEGDRVYLTSRYKTPDGRLRLAQFDIGTGASITVDDLDIEGTGGHRLASDGRYVYIGPSGSAWIWRYDPATRSVERWAEAGSSTTWYYSMTVHGGHLYIGTYPDCTVKRVRLTDGAVETYGRVSTSLYATAVVVDDEYVYAGSAAPGRLLRWPKDGGDAVDLSASLSESPVGILAMAASGGMLHVACGREVISIRPDGSDRVARPIPGADRYVDQLAVGGDGAVYAVARLTSNHYRVTPTELVAVGRPLDNIENQLLAVTADGRLVGVSGLGHVWNLQPGGPHTVWDTSTRGFGYPEVAQSMLLTRRQRVWVGGHFAITVHHPPSGTVRRFDVNGEPKALVEGRDGTVYAGMYPTGEIIAIDPDTLKVRVLGTLGHGQMRTRAMHFDADRNQLLVASGPTGGNHTGALTFIDLATGAFEVRKDFLPDQSVMSVAVSGSTAYIVGDTYGESTGGPILPAAQVAAVDLRTRQLLWREVLRPDWLSYEAVHAVDGQLYFMSRRPRGRWFAFDPASRRVVREGDLGGYGGFGEAGGRVFSWVHWTYDIRELPSERTPVGGLLHGGIPNGWYNNPVFNITPNGKATWGMHGTDLALFPLPVRS
ncbi:hypothetical protein [Microbacterium sp.]|uniref:hypothetical protein n=1 Tax=Microbacterium sp. TaxID=51671 RepID=UPI002810DFFC|nr:hypothetical protein [Microbacterium sp.]